MTDSACSCLVGSPLRRSTILAQDLEQQEPTREGRSGQKNWRQPGHSSQGIIRR